MTDPQSAAPGPNSPSAEGGSGTPAPSLLCDTRALTGLAAAPAGALWRLTESGRQLDANVIHLPATHRVDTHTEPDLDVLLLVLAGDGTLTAPDSTQHLGEGALFWLPHGSTRSLAAGEHGMSYLTVHRRRPGMQIRPRPDATTPQPPPGDAP
ncbi:MAG: hypothetical protein LBV60_04215 [Streptomyces sp.]|jgi:quercetin dioxygenase-like cupin family protein|nr:hypothetical protein [Streptomyces sp.]